MITIICPMGGSSLYEISGERAYPKILNEVNKKTLFEYSQDIFHTLEEDVRWLFLVPEKQDKALGLSAIVRLITGNKGTIIPLKGETRGALCSCLLSIDYFDINDEIIVSSADHFIRGNAQDMVDDFREQGADAGVLTFESLHPKWSYVKKNKAGRVIESAEKRAISREAIAGLFYFKRGDIFIQAAESVIKKGGDIDGEFYISSCLNEIILNGGEVITRALADRDYYNFYDNHAINVFSSDFTTNDYLRQLAERYIDYVSRGAISKLSELCTPDVVFHFDNETIVGRSKLHLLCYEIVKYTGVQTIYVSNNTTIVEYCVEKGEVVMKAVDILNWTQGNKISALHHYIG